MTRLRQKNRTSGYSGYEIAWHRISWIPCPGISCPKACQLFVRGFWLYWVCICVGCCSNTPETTIESSRRLRTVLAESTADDITCNCETEPSCLPGWRAHQLRECEMTVVQNGWFTPRICTLPGDCQQPGIPFWICLWQARTGSGYTLSVSCGPLLSETRFQTSFNKVWSYDAGRALLHTILSGAQSTNGYLSTPGLGFTRFTNVICAHLDVHRHRFIAFRNRSSKILARTLIATRGIGHFRI